MTHSIHPPQAINIPSDYCYSFCLAVYLAIYLFSFKLVSILLGSIEPRTKFYMKEKLKSEISMTKKVNKQIFFSGKTKNLN